MFILDQDKRVLHILSSASNVHLKIDPTNGEYVIFIQETRRASESFQRAHLANYSSEQRLNEVFASLLQFVAGHATSYDDGTELFQFPAA